MLCTAAGCLPRQASSPPFATMAAPTQLTKIEYPDAEVPLNPGIMTPDRPHTIRDLSQVQYWELPLDQAIRMALENSRVLRDLGGLVVGIGMREVHAEFLVHLEHLDPVHLRIARLVVLGGACVDAAAAADALPPFAAGPEGRR